MAALFLLAVKSRGEATFEIGERMICPECTKIWRDEHGFAWNDGNDGNDGCPECDGLGYWWITNSGYRAHPYSSWKLDDLCIDVSFGDEIVMELITHGLPAMPNDLPDLFPAKQSKSIISSGKSLLQSLGLLPKVVRRL